MAVGQKLPDAGTFEAEAWLAELHKIIREQSVFSVYQPILSLETGTVTGYEALTRGPADSPLHSPWQLFRFAERWGQQYVLDRIAREKAIGGFRFESQQQLLFINISAHILYDPNFIPGRTLEVLQRFGLQPNNIVFEITERSSIEDFSLAKKILEHYRKQGYRIAIDDAGAGYSSLQAIAELHPDFIKVDRSLVENIHKDKIKECILETFVTFAQKMNIGLIAEGIEQREELVKLTRMGVQYAQGYLLARPGTLPVSIDPEMISHIQLHRRASSSAEVWMIGDLAAPVKTFDVKTPVSEVVSYFKRQSDEPAAVLVSGEAPVGLIMREQLFRQMSGQYSFSLYSHRTIDNLMDAQPLMVESSMPVEQVSQLATSRDKPNLYDLVIITREGRMAGAASIHSILETITNIRMENARVANPLTGLPGNLQINRELSKRLLDNKDFSIIYIDLDFFKWFNDRYGFQKGDQLIQYTADILQQSIAVCGSPHDFVGHVGGDDFIVLTSAEDAAKMCGEMIRRFDQGVRLFYEGEDWRSVEDRNGNPIDNDGVTLSLSLLRCAADSGVTQEQISQVSAKLKKKAKAHRGSVYVSYRVGEPGL